MSAPLTLEGYLIRTVPLAGGDRIFKILTRERGFLPVFVQARRVAATPSLAAPCTLDRGAFTLTLRRSHPGGRLWEHRLLERHLWLAEPVDRLSRVLLLAETMERLSAEEDPLPGGYDLLSGLLSTLRRTVRHRPLLDQALLHFLAQAGYALPLDRCAACGRPLPETPRIPCREGLPGHPACLAGREPGPQESLSRGTLRYLAALAGRRAGETGGIQAGGAAGREADRLLGGYVSSLVQRRLRSQEFLAKVAEGP